MRLSIPYGDTYQHADVPDSRVRAVLQSGGLPQAAADPHALVRQALDNPIGSPRLRELAAGASRALVITSDHTRPVPSAITLPPMLQEMRLGNPDIQIKILIATGCHRASTPQEMADKFGPELLAREEFVIHDARRAQDMARMGTLPSGGELRVNRLAADWADLIVSDGFLEPHFFAGFSGGRKSVLPGIASQRTVMANHCAAFIADPRARAGILQGNPIHTDMRWAADAVGLRFILNVVLDAQKRIVAAFAGDTQQAHSQGCAYVARHAQVGAVPADIVVTSNGGYPLDQNIYQCVKGMTAAEACVNPGGVVILCASCCDGHGSEDLYDTFARGDAPQEILRQILRVPADQTRPDQWQAQILARVLCRSRVILVSDQCDHAMIRAMQLTPAASLAEALALADAWMPGGSVTVIPDGVSVIVQGA